MSRNKEVNKLIDKIKPFCSRIEYGQKHIKAYPLNSKEVIILSSTPSDINHTRVVLRRFKNIGIFIK